MFGLTPKEAFIAGVGALWLFSAAVGAMQQPAPDQTGLYPWAYKFLKSIAGDLTALFGKYIPPAPPAQ